MPPKRKDIGKTVSKLKKRQPKVPETEIDFLEAADDHEQSGGKWRAGDAAKAVRFFQRAIDAYDEGLRRFPRSFDLAYNKANLEYQLTQDARLASHLGNDLDLLHEALESHRSALSLSPENANIQFNMGQVLTSLAEALVETLKTDADAESNRAVARSFLKEAVQKFSDCLACQEQEYSDMQLQIEEAKAQEADGGVVIDPSASVAEHIPDATETSSDSPGDWATVIEPVTPSDLLETAVAQLNSLSTLVSISYLGDGPTLDRLLGIATPLVTTKIPHYMALLPSLSPMVPDSTPVTQPSLSFSLDPAASSDLHTPIKDDALLAIATFRAALLESTYRSNLLSFTTYSAHLADAFAPLTPSATTALTPSTVNILSAHYDALVAFASALAETPNTESKDERMKAQYTALSRAQTFLGRLTAPATTEMLQPARVAELFLARGDVELSRLRYATENAIKLVLVKNAGVFYRGSKAWAGRVGGETTVAEIKAAVAEMSRGEMEGNGHVTVSLNVKTGEVDEVLRGMVEEGLIDMEVAEKARKFFV